MKLTEKSPEKSEKKIKVMGNSPLFASDLDFLANRAKLSRAKLLKLIELPRDLDLVLSTLSTQITQTEARKLQNKAWFYKILVYKHAFEYDFDIESQSYIAKAIEEHMPKILKKRKSKVFISKNPTDSATTYLLIAGVITNQKLDICHIESSFRTNGQRDIANNIEKWIDIIRKAAIAGWFNNE